MELTKRVENGKLIVERSHVERSERTVEGLKVLEARLEAQLTEVRADIQAILNEL